jgi:TolB-like protein/DNA-binding winged helix-turn-helix (wHTH) protein/Flp pilus assembly protein TadD
MGGPSTETRPIRFGVFEFDPQSRELRRNGLRVRLNGQPVDILIMLLARPGELITREELSNRLWPADTFVDFEPSLNAAMKRLRAALGDSAETPRFVETLARRGYRFIASVESGEAAPVPVVVPGQRISWRSRSVAIAIAVAVAGVALAITVAAVRGGRVRAGNPGRVRSLLVLPLQNLSGDPEQEFLADGITDAINAHLAGISALRVISQTSSTHYKRTNKSLAQIGAEVNVDAIVEGSVLRSGTRIRINLQLLEAASEKRIWGHTYERDLEDVLTLQREVARAIVDEIRVKLSSGEQARLAKARGSNPRAHLAYARGRFYWNKRTDEGLRRAAVFFEEAIRKDPGYALAYAGLADSWVPRAWYGYVPPREAFSRAKAAVTRALELDADLPEAHTTLAFITLYYDWQWAAAEREFQRAIELNPNYANAHHWYAEYLSLRGRHEEGIRESERARDLDPLSSIINTWVGSRYFFARRYDMAVEQYRNVVEMDSDFVPAHMALGQAYEQKGMFSAAIEELERAAALSGRSPVYLASLAHACGIAGKTKEALRLVDELKKASVDGYVASFDMAVAYLGTGDKERTLGALERSVGEHSPRLLFLIVDPRFDPLRSESRFEAVVARVRPPG